MKNHMPMLNRPTGTPWYLDYGNGSSIIVGQEKGLPVSIGQLFPVQPCANQELNARHIVHCVNGHDELVNALKALHDYTKEYIEINNLGNPYHNKCMQLAKQALAKESEG